MKVTFKPDGQELLGWAVSVKTDVDSADGKGRFRAEDPSTEGPSRKPVKAGNGVGLCTGCHRAEQDMVLNARPE